MRWVVSINPLDAVSFIAKISTETFFVWQEQKKMKKKSRKDEQQYKLERKLFIRLDKIMRAKE